MLGASAPSLTEDNMRMSPEKRRDLQDAVYVVLLNARGPLVGHRLWPGYSERSKVMDALTDKITNAVFNALNVEEK